MGQLLRATSAALTLERTAAPGVEVLFRDDGALLVRELCELTLDEASPLTPRAARFVRPPRGQDRVSLSPGVYWLRRAGVAAEDYLTVDAAGARQVTKAEAYCHLGALEVLLALGLEDAAVSLRAGDFDLASVQVLEELARRRAAQP